MIVAGIQTYSNNINSVYSYLKKEKNSKPAERKFSAEFCYNPINYPFINIIFTGGSSFMRSFAGHNKEKELTKDIFYNDACNNNLKASPYILYYAPNREISERFISGIIKEFKNEAVITKLDNVPPQNFVNELKNTLEVNKKQIKSDNKKKGIIYIPNAEKYLSSNNEENIPIIQYFKSLADYCNTEKGYQTTIIMSTSAPQIIDEDLLHREGKMTVIPIEIDTPQDLTENFKLFSKELKRDIIAKYINLTDGNVNEIPYKLAKNIEDADEKFIQKLDSLESLDYSIPAELASPSKRFGGYSNKKLKEIYTDAVYKYLTGENRSLIQILASKINSGHRDIKPAVYSNFEKTKNKIILSSEEYAVSIRDIFENFVEPDMYSKELMDRLHRFYIRELRKMSKQEDLNLSQMRLVSKFNEKENSQYRDSFYDFVKNRIIKYKNGRYRLYYGNDRKEYFDLYLGSFGKDKSVIWIEPKNEADFIFIKELLPGIKRHPVFKDAKLIQFPEFPNAHRIDKVRYNYNKTVDYRDIMVYTLD